MYTGSKGIKAAFSRNFFFCNASKPIQSSGLLNACKIYFIKFSPIVYSAVSSLAPHQKSHNDTNSSLVLRQDPSTQELGETFTRDWGRLRISRNPWLHNSLTGFTPTLLLSAAPISTILSAKERKSSSGGGNENCGDNIQGRQRRADPSPLGSPGLLVAELLRHHLPQVEPQAISHPLGQVLVRTPAEEHDVGHGWAQKAETSQNRGRGGGGRGTKPREGEKRELPRATGRPNNRGPASSLAESAPEGRPPLGPPPSLSGAVEATGRGGRGQALVTF